jgi:FdhE protein
VTISERDRQILQALETAQQQHPALVDLLKLHFDLYQAQFEAKADLPEPEVRDDIGIRWRLEGGISQLTFDQLGVEPQPFARVVENITDVLVMHSHPALQVGDQKWSPEELVVRAAEVFETWDTLTAPRAARTKHEGPLVEGLTAQAVGFALAPYLQRASERILPHLDLDLWHHGYCPVCGGRPNLVLLGKENASRQMVCSRCVSVWNYEGSTCPFCEADASELYCAREDGLYHLYVCPGCNAYLKAVDLQRAQRDVYPLVECLLTVTMDLVARQEGYEN